MITLTFDTETSGLPLFKEPYHDPRQPWVMQLTAVVSDDTRVYHTYSTLIRHDGRDADQGAIDVHGLTLDMCKQFGASEERAIAEFGRMLMGVDLLVGHNIKFDMLLLCGMYHRVLPTFIPNLLAIPTCCTMSESTNLLKLPGRYGYKWSKLTELHGALFNGEEFDAHDALADVMATRRCFYELLARETIKFDMP